jgi:CRISPR system Cascade subunit CasC
MLIQIHMLQSYAPANLNRDDTGAPKDAVFGGVVRGRISSQCLKRSIRRSAAFQEAFAASGLLGIRTKKLPDMIRAELAKMGVDEVTVRNICRRVPELGRESSKGKPAGQPDDAEEEAAEDGGDASASPASAEKQAETETETKQLIFLGQNETRPLAERLLAAYQREGLKKWDKLKIADIAKEMGGSLPKSVDVAMFGRMTTSEAFQNVQAAVQVAHAISTNTLTQEFDYYTAVDDLSGESGAGMIGDVEFNSSTYYKYLNIHWEQLVTNLGGDTEVAAQAVLALLEAAATAQPTGKQNTFAAHSLPDLVLVEAGRRNLPVSYANAFLRPAQQSGPDSLMDASAALLAGYMGRIIPAFGLESNRAYLATGDWSLPQATRQTSLRQLGDWLSAQIAEG